MIASCDKTLISVNLYVYSQSEEHYGSIQRDSLTVLEFYTQKINTNINDKIKTTEVTGQQTITLSPLMRQK